MLFSELHKYGSPFCTYGACSATGSPRMNFLGDRNPAVYSVRSISEVLNLEARDEVGVKKGG